MKKNIFIHKVSNITNNHRKLMILNASGKGNRPNKASSLTTEDEDVVWRCGTLTMDDPVALTTTLWWFFTTGIGLRGHIQVRGKV